MVVGLTLRVVESFDVTITAVRALPFAVFSYKGLVVISDVSNTRRDRL
jgi:hypothetical protein